MQPILYGDCGQSVANYLSLFIPQKNESTDWVDGWSDGQMGRHVEGRVDAQIVG